MARHAHRQQRSRSVLGLVLVFAIIAGVAALLVPHHSGDVAHAQIVTGDNTSNKTSTISSGTTCTITSFAVGSSPNRLLLVGVSWSSSTVSVIGVTFGAQSLSAVANSRATNAAGLRTELWSLVAPNNTTANIVVTMSATTSGVAGASSWSGVSQTTPLGTPFIAANTSNSNGAGSRPGGNISASLVHDSLQTDLALDVVAAAGSGSVSGLTGDQTQLYNTTGGTAVTGAGSRDNDGTYHLERDRKQSRLGIHARPSHRAA